MASIYNTLFGAQTLPIFGQKQNGIFLVRRTAKEMIMEENKNNQSTQYIRSNNMDNTVDNLQRNTKEEDSMNPDYTNPPIGKKEQDLAQNNNKEEGENRSST